VDIRKSSASACRDARKGRPDWHSGAAGKANGVHGPAFELALHEQHGIREASLDAVAGDELVFPSGLLRWVLAE
jgi:hypothetical protein